MIRVGSIVIRVDDLQLQAEFWEAALDYERRVMDDDFVLLRGHHPLIERGVRNGDVHSIGGRLVTPLPLLGPYDVTTRLRPGRVRLC